MQEKAPPRKLEHNSTRSNLIPRMSIWADSVDYETGQRIQTATTILPDRLLRSPSQFHQLRWDLQFPIHMMVTRLQTRISPRVLATRQPVRAHQTLRVSRSEDKEPFRTAAARSLNSPTTMKNKHLSNRIPRTSDNVRDFNVTFQTRNPEIFLTVENVPT